jgi:geranylgeranylglycerol-phosphate geranylgeranyltransferase
MGVTISNLLLGIAAGAAAASLAAVAAAIAVGALFHCYAHAGYAVMNLPFDRSDPGGQAVPLARSIVAPQAALFLALVQLGPMFLVAGAATAAAAAPLACAVVLRAAYNVAGEAMAVPFLGALMRRAGSACLVLAGSQLAGGSTALTAYAIGFVAVGVPVADGIVRTVRDWRDNRRAGPPPGLGSRHRVAPTTALRTHLRAYWEMSRPGTPVVAMALTVTGATLGGPRYPAAILAMAAPACVVGAANLYNDRCDQATDVVNRPDRPLPAGTVGGNSVDRIVMGTAVVGVASTVPLGTAATAAAGMLLAVALAYSLMLRRTAIAGPVAVAVLFAVPVLYGGWFASSGVQPAHWVAAGQVALFVFARETLKSIPDVKGDAAVGYRTLATELGEATALRIFRLAAAASVVVTLLPFALGSQGPRYLAAATLFVVAPTAAAIWRLRREPTASAIQAALATTGLVFAGGVVPLLMLR